MTTEPGLPDKLFTFFRIVLLAIAFPLMSVWIVFLVARIGFEYYDQWRMIPGLFISAIPYLPLALIAFCSAAYVITQVALETWNRMRHHIAK